MTSKHHINKKEPKCFHCGKFGHLKHNSHLLGEVSKESVKRDYPKKKAFLMKKTKVEPSCSKKEPVGLFAHHTLTTNNNKRAHGLVLWHINLCRLFNTKSIFM